MVHIVPHWNFKGLEGKEIPVTAYTNCDELELFLNGESQGRKAIERYGRGEWKVVYTPGKLEVKGYCHGKLCAADTRITTGRPETMRLTMDNTCVANGRDIALFTCECLDANGNVVPDAAEFVKTIQSRQGITVSALEEIAYRRGFIDKETLIKSAEKYGKSSYGKHLLRVAEEINL